MELQTHLKLHWKQTDRKQFLHLLLRSCKLNMLEVNIWLTWDQQEKDSSPSALSKYFYYNYKELWHCQSDEVLYIQTSVIEEHPKDIGNGSCHCRNLRNDNHCQESWNHLPFLVAKVPHHQTHLPVCCFISERVSDEWKFCCADVLQRLSLEVQTWQL